MSGYWTVLTIKHIFGGRPADYMQELIVGTDTLGDTNPNAKNNSSYRDVQSELAGQSIDLATTTLTEYSLSPNSSSLENSFGDTLSTQVNTVSPSAIPALADADPFYRASPNLSQVTNVVRWTATDAGKVIS
jgi:hypothetical protein